jgi:hypothetical protein
MLRMAGDGVWAGNIFLRNSALQCVWASLRPLAGKPSSVAPNWLCSDNQPDELASGAGADYRFSKTDCDGENDAAR